MDCLKCKEYPECLKTHDCVYGNDVNNLINAISDLMENKIPDGIFGKQIDEQMRIFTYRSALYDYRKSKSKKKKPT